MSIYILGMHRSGTSLLTRFVNLMGVDAGSEDDLMAAQEDNPKGFWERRDVCELNDSILQEFGAAWDKPLSFSPQECSDEQFAMFEQRAKAILDSLPSLHVLKDPRFCLTFPLWRRVVEKPVCLFAYRRPEEVAMSLRKRDEMSLLTGAALWEYYNFSALKIIQDVPTFFVSFDEVFRDPVRVCKNIHKFLQQQGVAVNNVPRTLLKDYFSKELRHHFADKESLVISESQMGMFSVLSGKGKKDTIKEFSIPSRYILQEYQDVSRRSNQLGSDNKSLNQELSRLTAELDAMREGGETVKQQHAEELFAKVETLQHNHDEALRKKDEELFAKVETLQHNHDEALRKKDEELFAKVETLQHNHDEALRKKDEELFAKVETLQHNHDEALRKKGEELFAKVETLQHNHDEALRKKDEELFAKVETLQHNHDEALRKKGEELFAKVETLQHSHDEALRKKDEELFVKVETLQCDHNEALRKKDEDFSEERSVISSAHRDEISSIEQHWKKRVEVVSEEEKASRNTLIKNFSQERECWGEFRNSIHEHMVEQIELGVEKLAEYKELVELQKQRIESLQVVVNDKQSLENKLQYKAAEREKALVQLEAEYEQTLYDRKQELEQVKETLKEELKNEKGKLTTIEEDFDHVQRWITELAGDVRDVRMSLRWRLGSALIGCLAFVLKRGKQKTAMDHACTVIDEFQLWQASRFNSQPVRPVNISSGQRSMTLVGLVGCALRQPALTWKLLNYERMRNLLKTMQNNDSSFRETVWGNYLRMYNQDKLSPVEKCLNVCMSLKDEVSESSRLGLVSIVIPVYNQWEFTKECIRSIEEHCSRMNYEIIIADDNSSDDTCMAAQLFPAVTVVRNEKNVGFLRNCNNAAQTAKGQYLVFLNNDTTVTPGWLEALYTLMERHKDAAIVGSKLVYPDGTLQEAGGIIWNDASGWNYGRNGDPEASEFNYVKEVDYISGASIMVRRCFWDQVGGFDERYIPAYCEDSDLAFEARRLGYKVLYQPKSVVVHFEGKSHGTDAGTGIKKYQVINNEKFREKWNEVLCSEHLPNSHDVFLARDRSTASKHLLYIDHYVPHFDQDAGARTAFHYLKLFIEMGIRVTFIGDNYFRHEPYTTELQQMGIEVLYGPYYSEKWKKWFTENSRYFDYVFLNRPHIAEKYIDFIKAHSAAKIFYYGHDLHFLREMRRMELEKDDSLLDSVACWKEKELALCSKSDVVFYPSSVETDILKELLPHKEIKPIPAYIYKDVPDREYDADARSGLLFVGGFGHPPNAQAVEFFLNEILPLIAKENSDITFNIVGSKAPTWLEEYNAPNVKVWGFVDDEQLEALYKSVRIVVVPLLYGAGVKGKVIEALYQGVPVVTTSVGAEGIPEAEDLLVVQDSPADFARSVIELYGDQEQLVALSKKARTFIHEHFSTKKAQHMMEVELELDGDFANDYLRTA